MCKLRGTAIVLGNGATHGGCREHKKEDVLMKRILVLVTVVTLMAAMMAAMAMPAFALGPGRDRGACATRVALMVFPTEKAYFITSTCLAT